MSVDRRDESTETQKVDRLVGIHAALVLRQVHGVERESRKVISPK